MKDLVPIGTLFCIFSPCNFMSPPMYRPFPTPLPYLLYLSYHKGKHTMFITRDSRFHHNFFPPIISRSRQVTGLWVRHDRAKLLEETVLGITSSWINLQKPKIYKTDQWFPLYNAIVLEFEIWVFVYNHCDKNKGVSYFLPHFYRKNFMPCYMHHAANTHSAT